MNSIFEIFFYQKLMNIFWVVSCFSDKNGQLGGEEKKELVDRNVTFARADLSPSELAALHTDGFGGTLKMQIKSDKSGNQRVNSDLGL